MNHSWKESWPRGTSQIRAWTNEGSDRQPGRNSHDISTRTRAALCFIKTITCLNYLESLSGDLIADVFNNEREKKKTNILRLIFSSQILAGFFLFDTLEPLYSWQYTNMCLFKKKFLGENSSFHYELINRCSWQGVAGIEGLGLVPGLPIRSCVALSDVSAVLNFNFRNCKMKSTMPPHLQEYDHI